jgi:predicted DNA-binding transcriptional regulator YafY
MRRAVFCIPVRCDDFFSTPDRPTTVMSDPALLSKLPWDQRQRFRFIEAHAIWRGQVRVADVRDGFEVSASKAEKDFAAYARLSPGNLVRDRSTGEYRPTDAFVPRFLRGTGSEYLQVLRHHELGNDLPLAMAASGAGAAETLEAPAREFDVRVLARLNTAIRERRWLSIDYQSMTQPEPRSLRIAPHVLVFVQRWHARAWSAEHEGYRDFLLSRICGLPELLGPCERSADADWDWRNDVAIRIAPHPDLSAAQKRVVEQDYGMLHGMRETRVRVALAPYFLRMLGIGRGDRARAAQEQQIVLLNAADLDALNRLS